MEKFCLFRSHEYQDLYPQEFVRTFVGNTIEEITKAAEDYEAYMSQAYSGGTTKFLRVMDYEEAFNYVYKRAQEILHDPKIPELRRRGELYDFIKSKVKLLSDCYEEYSKFTKDDFIGIL